MQYLPPPPQPPSPAFVMAPCFHKRLGLEMTFCLVALLLLLISAVSAVPLATVDSQQFLDVNQEVSLPEGWKSVHLDDKTTVLKITLAVKQAKGAADAIDAALAAVSTPTSPLFGKHLSIAQITDLVRSEEHLHKVLTWLQDAARGGHGLNVSHVTANGDMVIVKATPQAVESVFNVHLQRFQHVNAGMSLIGTLQPYSVPSVVAASLDFVGGITAAFPRLAPPRGISMAPRRPSTSSSSSPSASGSCLEDSPDPTCLRKTYGVPANATGNPSVGSQAIASFAGKYFSPSDLSAYEGQHKLPKVAVSKVEGKNDASEPGDEATLDVQYIIGVSQGTATTFISIKDDSQTPFLDWVVSQADDKDAPLVQSVSWGTPEYEYPTVARLNVELAKLGARGLSVLFASGDDGAGCHDSKYSTNFPAASPYVTSVGGTAIPLFEHAIQADPISGGGFSNVGPTTPSWQADAVSTYLKTAKKLPPAKLYNSTGRGVPDVSAYSMDLPIIQRGTPTTIGGTSASTPIFAAIVSLLNQARLDTGKSPLGFLNPFLYANPNAFYDITVGSNPSDCGTGFTAAHGWDPITGMGTPLYAPLLDAALALP